MMCRGVQYPKRTPARADAASSVACAGRAGVCSTYAHVRDKTITRMHAPAHVCAHVRVPLHILHTPAHTKIINIKQRVKNGKNFRPLHTTPEHPCTPVNLR